MIGQVLVIFLVVVAVQANRHDGETSKVLAFLQKQSKTLRQVAKVPKHNLIKASCVNEFTFIPLTKDTVEKSKKCLTDIKSLNDLIEKNLKEERDEIEKALDAAAEKPHTVFDMMQLDAIAERYFKKLFMVTKNNKDIKADQSKYLNNCVKPGFEEGRKRTEAAVDKVKACYAKAKA